MRMRRLGLLRVVAVIVERGSGLGMGNGLLFRFLAGNDETMK